MWFFKDDNKDDEKFLDEYNKAGYFEFARVLGKVELGKCNDDCELA